MKTKDQLEQERVQRVKTIKGSLAYERKQAGFTQREVAAEIGADPSSIGAWELGDGAIGFEQAWRLADLYGITLDQLAGRPYARLAQ
jgi:transcriptional regulator with XRE-family HTH domain